MRKVQLTITLMAGLVLAIALPAGLGLSAAIAATTGEEAAEQAPQVVAKRSPTEVLAFALGAAFTTGMACVSAAYAVGKVGAAALGAASERPELLGRSLLFVGLAEGIAIYGLIIAILLLGRL